MSKLVAGNWKMFGDKNMISEIKKIDQHCNEVRCEVAICPPFPLILSAYEQTKNIQIGAQNCHTDINGAHTGEVSAEMLTEVGAQLIIVGHSERRQDNYESNDIVKLKSEAVHRAGATAVVCIGETLKERETDKTLSVLQEQMLNSLPKNVNPLNTVVAYEPVWAIGTGLVPEIDQIRAAHSFIRGFLASTYGAEAHNVKILYGGSVKGSNAKEIFSISNVNGALVGGASLKSNDFIEIITAASNSI
ncbi:triose-phosphate isomerase [Paracoccaceae bacterium]|jgi:triosephosphate isomerase|nr:triose-phosphate isomerase [Paracoccaceae bacterium]MDC0042766.1 triose-phosphate isomerase [Paracoccaceae bacterium]RCL81473.1 MAG: triose-phosphate isomerase [Paracoccaceae bacterium]|tara:strand:- start:1039 stop:1779 length:741 start_codon:yes stop_codon:yes gene_type:complete